MKKQTVKVLTFLAVSGTVFTGCDLLKDLDYTVTPDPLEMHGDSVRVKVDVVFPEKGINKKAYAEITPMLGTHALKPIRVQGEKATGNGNVIQYKAGGKVTYTDIIAYSPDMEACDLVVTGKVFKGSKEKDQIEETKIADATIITPLLVNKDFKVIEAKDQFQRVTEENFSATINYDKGRSVVKSSELRQEDIKAYQDFLAQDVEDDKVKIKTIHITGYASPEGEEDKNNTLSMDRATSAKEASVNLAGKAKNDPCKEDVIYNLKGSGEDYEGFKKALEADTKMNEDDKNLVLRVLETISSPTEREQAMRDMGKTFTYLDRNIFPALRRAEISVVYDQTGFSDEELKALSVSNPDTLNVEELLFTATLTDDLNEKMRLYKIVEERFPNDYRGVNNVGVILYMQNKVNEAKAQFEKAAGIENNAIVKSNLGAIAALEGDRQKAMSLFNEANAGDETNYNKGIINIQNGDYASAVSNFGEDSFNKALAQLLNGDAAAAINTIDNSADAETAQGYYLKAIASARQDKLGAIVDNLKNCFAKDAAYKEKAKKDREFIKYLENAAFTAIVK